jgi:GGDEF domain-containing protein
MNPAFEATVSFAPEDAGASSPSGPAWLQRLLRRLGGIPAELRDRSTGLYSRTGLFAAANEAMRTRAPDTPVSVVVLDVEDLHEVYQIYGSGIARKVADKLVRRLRGMAGWRGLAGRTGKSQFTVVLVGANEEKARRVVQRVLGKPPRIEFDAGDSEIVLVPELLVDTADPGADTLHPLHREMSRELARIQKEERRWLHFLTSERERHSRPMSLPQAQ